jgi:hypothetical protein
MTIKSISIPGLILVALALTLPAQAAGPMRLPSNTCEETNCNARSVGGAVLAFGSFAYAWVGEFVAGNAQCVRFDVTEQATDLEMIVIAPNGVIFQNDDKGAGFCPLCPLVKINVAPIGGWYTVRIGRSTGGAVDASFTMLVSQYNPGNANCADPTPPALLEIEGMKAAKVRR